jgi:transcription initiation factor IIE alpha subunit
MIEGTCPRCNERYYGWALREQRFQSCPSCGEQLLITEGRRKITKS